MVTMNSNFAGVGMGKANANESGMSLLAMLFFILIGGLLITCILKMGPVYLENWNFRSILTDLEEQFEQEAILEKSEIRSKIMRRMNIDMIDAIKLEDVTIKRDDDDYLVTGDYEARVELLGNVDVVMKFKNQVRLPITH